MHRDLCRALLVVCLCAPVALAAQGRSGQQQLARDTSAQKNTPAPTGSIAGHVAAADNGKQVKRARVMVTASELPGGRAAMTDETGGFGSGEPPAGRHPRAPPERRVLAVAVCRRRAPPRGPRAAPP